VGNRCAGAGDSHSLTVPIPLPEPPISPRREHRPRKPYKKRTPKSPFTAPEPARAESKIAAGNAWEARKAEAATEVAATAAPLRPPRRKGASGGKAEHELLRAARSQRG